MNIGDKAPEILGINEKGEEVRLSDYKGKKIVLYFYPKDSTSGCTAQACNLRDNYTPLTPITKTTDLRFSNSYSVLSTRI